MSDALLHPDYGRGNIGNTIQELLSERSDDVERDTANITDPNVSIVIRTRNESGRLGLLLADIDAQLFTGEKQIIVVDSGSSDGTEEVVRDFGAEMVHIDQATYSHPKALNLGFEAADHRYVLSLVGHTNLVAKTALKGLTRWKDVENFAGAYGPAALPDKFSSIWERQVSRLVRPERRLGPASPVTEIHPGAMVANRTVYVKEAWDELGRFDEDFGAGGEDKVLAGRMIAADMAVIQEPILTVYHSHSLGLAGTIKQCLYYRSLSKPQEFDAARLSYRQSLMREFEG